MPDKHEVGGSSPLGPTSAKAQRTLVHKHCLKRVVLPKGEDTTNLYGGVAQLGEHLPCKQGVMGSNPIISTIRAKLVS